MKGSVVPTVAEPTAATSVSERGVRDAAQGLTKAQWRFVKRGCISGDFSMVTVRALIRKGLFHIIPTSPNGRYGPATLTPLGEAVRLAISHPLAGPPS